jgi:hypothetical protein
MIRRVLSVPTYSPPLVTLWEIALSNSEKTKVLTGSLEIQFELAHDPLEQAVIETVFGGCGHTFPPASELKPTPRRLKKPSGV